MRAPPRQSVKVVFDTNVVASASFWRGAPFDCLAAWAQGRCVAVVSSNLLAEYHETVGELRLDYPGRKCVEWVEVLTESAELVFPVERVTGATPDSDDEMSWNVRWRWKPISLLAATKSICSRCGNFRASRLSARRNFCGGCKFHSFPARNTRKSPCVAR